MSSEDLVQRNVLVIPEGEFQQRAGKLSCLLSPLGTEFVLGLGAVPHISIYQAAYPQSNGDALVRAVEQISAGTPRFEIELCGFSVFWETFVFWDVVKTPVLTKLHQRMLNALNHLREGKLLPIHEQLLADQTIPADLRESIRRYGNPLCGDEERPHVTLARLKDPAQADAALRLLREFSTASCRFPVWGLCLGTVGSHGTG